MINQSDVEREALDSAIQSLKVAFSEVRVRQAPNPSTSAPQLDGVDIRPPLNHTPFELNTAGMTPSSIFRPTTLLNSLLRIFRR